MRVLLLFLLSVALAQTECPISCSECYSQPGANDKECRWCQIWAKVTIQPPESQIYLIRPYDAIKFTEVSPLNYPVYDTVSDYNTNRNFDATQFEELH